MGAAEPGTVLGNEDIPEFYVRYYKPFPAPDPAEWQLTIEGLVGAPAVRHWNSQRELGTWAERPHEVRQCWSSGQPGV
jgi:hypothetical protein